MTPEKPNLRELATAYPDLSVIRERTGDIVVFNRAKNTRTTIHLRKDDWETQLIWDVKLHSQLSDSDEQGRTIVQVRPNSPVASAAEIKQNDLQLDPIELIADARHGIDLFMAMLISDSFTRAVMQPIAYDYLHGNEAFMYGGLSDSSDDEIPHTEEDLANIGLTEFDLHQSPTDKYEYMYKLLNRDISIVEQLPQIPLTIGS